MKAKIITMFVAFLFSGMLMYGQSKTSKFEVWGKCGACEARIEKAAKAVDGVTAADWNKETKEMKVTFDESKTDMHKIEMAIAQAGHDTEMHRATDEAYDKLPPCCKYDRKGKDEKSGKKM